MEDTRLIDIKDRIKAELTGESLADGGWDEEEIIGYIDAALMTYPEYIPIKVKKDIRKCIMNEIIGYDVISELLENDDITDIVPSRWRDGWPQLQYISHYFKIKIAVFVYLSYC